MSASHRVLPAPHHQRQVAQSRRLGCSAHHTATPPVTTAALPPPRMHGPIKGRHQHRANKHNHATTTSRLKQHPRAASRHAAGSRAPCAAARMAELQQGSAPGAYRCRIIAGQPPCSLIPLAPAAARRRLPCLAHTAASSRMAGGPRNSWGAHGCATTTLSHAMVRRSVSCSVRLQHARGQQHAHGQQHARGPRDPAVPAPLALSPSPTPSNSTSPFCIASSSECLVQCCHLSYNIRHLGDSADGRNHLRLIMMYDISVIMIYSCTGVRDDEEECGHLKRAPFMCLSHTAAVWFCTAQRSTTRLRHTRGGFAPMAGGLMFDNGPTTLTLVMCV